MSEVFLGAFIPTSISGCQIWYDAADPLGTGTAPAIGTTITSWKDKSGKANHATGQTSAVTGSDSTGAYLNFTGSTYYTIGSGAFIVGQYFTIFIVERLQSSGFEQHFIGSSGTGTNQTLHIRYINTTSLHFAYYGNDLTSAGTIPAFTTADAQPTRVLTFSQLSTGRTTYVNSTSIAADTNNTLITGWSTPMIGQSFGGSYYTGRMREILIYTGQLTTLQRQQVEGYLGWKWGIQTSLPSAHPYYSVSPTATPGFPAAIQSIVTPSITPLNISGCALWLDAADSSSASMTLSGSSITAWKDKSGNGVSFTIGGTPTLSNAVYNGRSSVYFNGTTNFYNTTFSLNLVNHSFFIVVTETGGGNAGVLIFHNIAAGTHDVYSPNALEFSSPEFGVQGSYGAQPYSNLSYGVYGDTATPSTSNLILYKNGTSVVTKTGLTTTTSTGIVIGSRVYPSSYVAHMTGYVSEVLVYNTALNTAQRQQIEGYLANKWGINSSLQNTHPHYSVAPTLSARLAIIQPYPQQPTRTFSYTGADQSYVVPAGVTSLTVYMWGAGGGGGRYLSGGAGAALQGTLTVTPGETLTIVVGQAGGRTDNIIQPTRYGGGGAGIDPANGAYYSATGGGRSAIRRSGADIVTVAGGGGGGETSYGGAGSATGTGRDGNAGSQAAGTAYDGKGGTTSAGGAAGTGDARFSPTAGTLYTGGNAGNYAGGGGGGYYGGGGGTVSPGGSSGTAGGGGGSSLTTNLTNFIGYNSSDGNLAPFTSSSYYNGTASVGGQSLGYGGTGALGGNGLVVISPITPSLPAAIQSIVAPPITPLTVPNCVLWLDAADLTTLTLSGSTVTQWRDKSSTATVFTTSAGPALQTNAQNSKSAVIFTGQTMTGTNISPNGLTGMTMFLVAQQPNASLQVVGTGGFNNIFLYSPGGWGGVGIGTYQNGIAWRYGTGQPGNPTVSTTIGSGYAMVMINKNGVNETAWLNGTQVYSLNNALAALANNGASITLGSGTQGSFSENVAEILIYFSYLSLTQQQQIEGYLANKWGLKSSLPASHPYATAEPSIPRTIAIAPTPTSQVITSLSYTGSYITYTVPSNIVSLQGYLWGAGGAFYGDTTRKAGGGAFMSGTIAVSPGEQLRIIVGKGGSDGSNINSNYFPTGTDAQGAGGGGGGSGGQGGGRSAIQKFIGSTWTEVLTAGGGGGAAINAGDFGGNAHFTGTSQDAGNTYNQYTSAKGGTQLAGGLGATITGRTPFNYPSNNGAAFVGGTALLNTDGAGGGGGGGGYFGGGGGGYNGGAEVSGGGGGSSYHNPTYVTNFVGSNGNNVTPVANTLSFYDGAAGRAQGVYAVGSGSNGLAAFVATVGLPFPFPATTTGGTITPSGSYRIHTFTTVGTSTFTTNKLITAQVLVVAGGGGGGGQSIGGGGGAGGALFGQISLAPGSYSLSIGAGGAGWTTASATGVGVRGGNTVFGTLIANGGGGGGGNIISDITLLNGGCGGGAGNASSSIGTGSQGFGGGGRGPNFTGGGGGMGSVGSNGASSLAGSGGSGITYTLAGTNYTVCGGGGGGGYGGSTAGSGGSGIGGQGGSFGGQPPNQTVGSNATGYGSGGGGSPGDGFMGGAGFNGVVILAFIP